MTPVLAASSSILSPSLIMILLFVGVLAGLNVYEKGRWD